MAYQAMARRYRPSIFAEVVGQEHVARTLQNAIRTGRVAHAYLFCGPHGCGKTSMARIFAKALNCTGGPSVEPPPDCPICADISSGSDPDVTEIDGASNNSVEQVRTLREQAGYVPARARFKIYIIDEVHMLSGAAFNALLKTLEEPPPHVKFILATTEPHRLLETILSRCQRFDFRLIPPAEMAAHLKDLAARESVEAEPEALEAIAACAGGSVRDGLVLLDQMISYCPGPITRRDVEQVRGLAAAEQVVAVYDAYAARDLAAGLAAAEAVARQGTGAGDFLDQLVEYGRDLLHAVALGSAEGASAYGPARAALERHAVALSLEAALLALELFAVARTRVRGRSLTNPQVPLEMAIARLCGLEGVEAAGSVIARIEELAESGALAGGEDAVRLTPPVASAAAPAPVPAPPPASLPAPPHSAPLPPASPSASNASAPAPAAVSAGALSLEAVRERWNDALDAVRASYPPDSAYMHDLSPAAVEGEDMLVLEVPAGGVFLMEQLEDRERRARVTEAVSSALGRPVRLRLVIASPGESAAEPARSRAPAPNGAARQKALSDPVVRQVIERFKCDVMNVE